jgi:hypothetical protein
LHASVTGNAGDEFDAEVELPQIFRELAEAAEPAALAPAALASVRHQRRTRAGVTVAATLVVLAVVAGVAIAWLRPSPAPDPTGLTVVTSYRDGGSSYVLNPDTGDYEPWSFAENGGVLSPDLRTWAVPSAERPAVHLRTLAGRWQDRNVSLPASMLSKAWSTDGRRLVATPIRVPELPPPDDPNYEAVLAQPVDASFRNVMIVDADTAAVTEVALDLPADHVGGFPTFWVGTDRFAVPILDATQSVPTDGSGTGSGDTVPPMVSFGVFDLTGALVTELPTIPDGVDPAGLHDGLIWGPSGLVRGDQVLLIRYPEPGRLELAVANLRSVPASYQAIAVDAPPEAEPVAWLPDGRVIVAAQDHADTVVDTVSIVDLDTGTMREVNPAAELPPELPIPDTATNLTFADADPLAPDAAHLAFLP